MIGNKKIVCIIPARLASVRFPEKVLQKLGDKPLLQWVWEAAKAIPFFDECHFAIDDVKTAALLDQFGASWHMTSHLAESGTDRLVELMLKKTITSDIWVNWQGDEPFVNKEMVQDLLQGISSETAIDMWTLKKKITDPMQIRAANIAKVVTDQQGNALYFSRSPIPFYRDQILENCLYFKHVGIYAYTTRGLEMIGKMPPSRLEQAEKLEQLRFLEQGLKIRLHETTYEVRGIDTPEDLSFAEQIITKNKSVLQNL